MAYTLLPMHPVPSILLLHGVSPTCHQYAFQGCFDQSSSVSRGAESSRRQSHFIQSLSMALLGIELDLAMSTTLIQGTKPVIVSLM